MKLKNIPEGAGFRIASLNKTGKVIRTSPMSVLVKYDSSRRKVEITQVNADDTETVRSFESEGRPVNISLETEVEAI